MSIITWWWCHVFLDIISGDNKLALTLLKLTIFSTNQVQILQKLDHPHIVHYLEAFFDRKQDNLFIIQVGCLNGIYHKLLENKLSG